jgi:hypothetical protein
MISKSARSERAARRKLSFMRPRRTAIVRLLAISRRQSAQVRPLHHRRRSERCGQSAPWSRRCRSRQASRNCRAPGSRATLVAIGFPLRPVQAAKPAFLRAPPDSPQRGVRLLSAANRASRYQARDLPPMTCDYHLLPALYQVQQMAKLVLRLKGTDLAHNPPLI